MLLQKSNKEPHRKVVELPIKSLSQVKFLPAKSSEMEILDLILDFIVLSLIAHSLKIYVVLCFGYTGISNFSNKQNQSNTHQASIHLWTGRSLGCWGPVETERQTLI